MTFSKFALTVAVGAAATIGVTLMSSTFIVDCPNLVVNGSFEDPQLSPGTWSVFATIPGWTTSGGSGIEIQNNVAGSAFDGNQLVELDSNSPSSMYQNVPTIPGRIYTVEFHYSPRPGYSSNGLNVEWNGSSIATMNRSGVGNLDTDWSSHDFDVAATGASTRLEFFSTNPGGSTGVYIDDVAVHLVPMDVVALYSQTKKHNSGSCIPIKIQVKVGDENVSSSTTVTAVKVVAVPSGTEYPAIDEGNANPGGVFRYDSELGGDGGLIFNLKTTGLPSGSYKLVFTTGDGCSYEVGFMIR